MTQPLKAPYPWPGGKSKIAPLVWERFGRVENYVEGFCGSAAMLLGRPGGAQGTETVNDVDGLLINALRSITLAPDETAQWCDWPVSEADLTSRHLWLKGNRDELTSRLFGDPLYCNPQAAGWWLWGIASWIGDGWCVADGPWVSVEGRLVDRRTLPKEEQGEGVGRQMPIVSANPTDHAPIQNGIHRYRAAVPRQMPEVAARLTHGQGSPRKGIQAVRYGVPRKMPLVGGTTRAGTRDGLTPHVGIQRERNYAEPTALSAYFSLLSDRLRRVRFLCGDWRRCVKDSITVNHGTTSLFLDPPYPSAEHGMAYHGDNDIWHQVAHWAVSKGDDPRLRIALCGYFSEEADSIFPSSWTRYRWEAAGGYSNQSENGRGRANARRECVWFSPTCIDPTTDYGPLFEALL